MKMSSIALTVFLVVLCIHCNPAFGACQSTGGNCVSDCAGKANGDYQSCLACNVYVTCSNGNTYHNRPCAAAFLLWDDNVKRCEWTSSTCNGCANTNGCSSTPCLNGGVCSDTASGYTCACPSGYTGDQCQTVTAVPPITVNITCDNILYFFSDGQAVVDSSTSGYNNWPVVNQVHIPGTTRVYAVMCVDLGVVAGILASFSNGVVTDASWRCTTGAVASNWNKLGADLSGWVVPTEIRRNTGNDRYWGSPRPGIRGNAKWIWTRNWDNPIDTPVYCRKDVTP